MFDGLIAGMLGLVGTQLAAESNASMQEDQQRFNAEQAALNAQSNYNYWRRQNNAIYAKPIQSLRNVTQDEIRAKYNKYVKAFDNENNYVADGPGGKPYIAAINLLGQSKLVQSVEDAMAWWQYGTNYENAQNAQGGYQYQANNANLDYITKIPTATRQGLVDAGYNPLSAFDISAASQPAMSTAANNVGSQAQSGIGHGMDAQAFVSAAKNIIDGMNETRLTNAQTQNIDADTKLKNAQTADIAKEREQKTADYKLALQRYDLEDKRLFIDSKKIDTELERIEQVMDLDEERMSIEKRKEIADYVDKGLRHAVTIGALLTGLSKLKIANDKLNELVTYFRDKFYNPKSS